ncbi:thioredoxin family protein [Tenacibaculum finnmarkense]|uniref:thioredoxin family protein n=1 Tax=Tenacibaculum finnmarkense TaxID=2781243 RepID=UPI00187B400C|nr:DUF255 domain-containing protein [Tenacibaculum finnmarkense]MBE7633114.1 DUF255 domain-containing protein [Tenacibaculum finnmarkense genomovar ulcerans]MBE7646936.1 DUF255 domain-containing protein [Tenacibaculum finnmarkense genomovar ulcerans]MBE7686710.1 DUF255 domain-containing protein [Tenacibaculum finnmarkense genomovar ulcerans]MBE7691725.1 DUF255 domain-containing protein [Tenacibaculum finnmarkense genomovar finnmarkense]MCD8429033.1 DUF255 domain-containing protein [Tenacibacul
MKNLFLVLFLAIISVNVNAQEEVNWLTFEEAIEKNIANPKPILVSLYTDWCGWCKKMDKTTYKNNVLVSYINKHYYAVKMDGEGKDDISFNGTTYKYIKQDGMKYHELAAQIMKGQMSYPSTAFFDPEKRLIQTIPGYLEKQRFEKIINFFTKDTYKTTEWTTFEKEFKSTI